MLIGLNVQHIALIEKLQLELQPGLNILTGETGAGKSILLDALGLALGQRADGRLVRNGYSQGVVQAEFIIPPDHPVYHLLTRQNLLIDTNEPLILRRQLQPDGRSRCFMNDLAISNSLLKQVGQLLVDAVAQFDQHRLHQPHAQMELLDRFANLQTNVKTVADLYANWRQLQQQHQEEQSQLLIKQRNLEYDQHILAELDQLNPHAGEEEKLLAERQLANQQEKLRHLLQDLYQDLQGEKGASKNLTYALRRLERTTLPSIAFEGVRAALQQSLTFAQEALDLLHPQLHQAQQDVTARLEQIEDRLSQLRELARKNQVKPDELPSFHQQLRQKLENVQQADRLIADLEHQLQKSQQELSTAAEDLHHQRCQAAEKLTRLVQQYLVKLHLKRTVFKIDVSSLPTEQWNSTGSSYVNFMASINPGSPVAPLHKIASGGELSRFMLALKMALQQSDPVSTMIFDEIDTGVSGATAAAVGEILASLAQSVQLLVVTHLPQVACQGATHWLVSKKMDQQQTNTHIHLLDSRERQEEIARLIAGTEITDEARAAAAKLLMKTTPLHHSKRLKKLHTPSNKGD